MPPTAASPLPAIVMMLVGVSVLPISDAVAGLLLGLRPSRVR